MFWKKKLTEEDTTPSSQSEFGVSDTSITASAKEPAVIDGRPVDAFGALAQEKSRARAELLADNSEDDITSRFSRVRSALGAGTVIQGKLSFDTPVRIDGKLSGEVYSSSTLVVGATGVVDAEVQVACLVVMGVVRGKIYASEKIEVLSGGTLDGVLATPSLSVEDGTCFNCTCTMSGLSEKKSAAAHEKGVATRDDRPVAGTQTGSKPQSAGNLTENPTETSNKTNDSKRSPVEANQELRIT